MEETMCMNINAGRDDVMMIVASLIENYPEVRIDNNFSRDVITATDVYITIHIDATWEITMRGDFPEGQEVHYALIWDHCNPTKRELKYVG